MMELTDKYYKALGFYCPSLFYICLDGKGRLKDMKLFSIKETKKLCTILTLKRFVGGVLSLIDIAVNHSAILIIRIDEGKVLDASENEERKPLFANVASKDVRINTKLLMGVLKEMGAHRDLSVCIKVEG